MPTRKIEDPSKEWNIKEACRDRSHNPPNMMVFEPGTWEHECPSCGKIQRFFVGTRYF